MAATPPPVVARLVAEEKLTQQLNGALQAVYHTGTDIFYSSRLQGHLLLQVQQLRNENSIEESELLRAREDLPKVPSTEHVDMKHSRARSHRIEKVTRPTSEILGQILPQNGEGIQNSEFVTLMLEGAAAMALPITDVHALVAQIVISEQQKQERAVDTAKKLRSLAAQIEYANYKQHVCLDEIIDQATDALAKKEDLAYDHEKLARGQSMKIGRAMTTIQEIFGPIEVPAGPKLLNYRGPARIGDRLLRQIAQAQHAPEEHVYADRGVGAGAVPGQDGNGGAAGGGVAANGGAAGGGGAEPPQQNGGGLVRAAGAAVALPGQTVDGGGGGAAEGCQKHPRLHPPAHDQLDVPGHPGIRFVPLEESGRSLDQLTCHATTLPQNWTHMSWPKLLTTRIKLLGPARRASLADLDRPTVQPSIPLLYCAVFAFSRVHDKN
ncbi:unnamed protein product, partial [Mesorhabditis spiculigera]